MSKHEFKIISEYKPTGDQPVAIGQLVDGIEKNVKFQTLLGVTGSGKTFSIANVIEKVNKPTLILSHNKTLAAQLYGEFKEFFPENLVEYFVSYYDYYQPEAYIPSTDMYIEKDLSINAEIEKLRLSTTSALLSGRRDVIVVSSVSCLYGIGNPKDFNENIVNVKQNQKISRNVLLRHFVQSLYSRNDTVLTRGTFRVKGDTVDIFVAYGDLAYRFTFWGDEIEEIISFDPETGIQLDTHEEVRIYPASIFMSTKETLETAIKSIQIDLGKQIEFFRKLDRNLEAKRIEDRVTYDLEMLKELGHCSGVENYSRYFDGRLPGSRPFCLIDYFPKDFLCVIDESHATIPQIRAMYGGDHSRKTNLIEYGFRLPAAIDNRPLKFEEFESISPQTIYVSATPADYELHLSDGVIVEQVIRPTGLLDPPIEVRPSLNQMDDLMDEIHIRSKRDERILVTTLTKRMAEELVDYFVKYSIRCRYVHSDVDTLERVQILDDLRAGRFDVLVGVNLLREGLDLPEVSLVAILDADKEGFLRSARALTQTAGRAARNIQGKVIFYADKITKSMQITIEETNRRREKQIKYNSDNNITPQPIVKGLRNVMGGSPDSNNKAKGYSESENVQPVAADPVIKYMTKPALQKALDKTRNAMMKAAKELDFLTAAKLRDEMFEYEKLMKEKY